MRTTADTNVPADAEASARYAALSSDDATYSRNPAAKPPTQAAARDVALARAAILATAIGCTGLPRPRRRARRLRPLQASAAASSSSAGTPVHGSAGSTV